MKTRQLLLLGLSLLMVSVPSAFSQAAAGSAGDTSAASAEKEVITLSKDKWQWMAERNVEALDKLFADEAVFVGRARIARLGGRARRTNLRAERARESGAPSSSSTLIPVMCLPKVCPLPQEL